MNDFSIRKASIEDLDEIYHIEQHSFSEGIKETKATFKERIENFANGFILLIIKHKKVGYFATELWQKSLFHNDFTINDFTLGHSAKKTHINEGNTLYLSSMAILPQFRGSGLGKPFFTASMDYISKENPSIKQQVLLVNEEWLPARKIYEHAGFSKLCSFVNFFETAHKKSEGIVMIKKLYE
ncbi:MAG: GNAT family N-acetyltransferase [Treponemataceae bacterium]